MTDPTPTRAEVEAFRPEAIIPSSDTVILPKSQFKRWCENYQASLRAMEDRHFAEEAALRERAEAAERDRDEHKAVLRMTGEMLTAARRAEAAAWNDAIEAAGNLESIHGYSNAVPRHRIRALRRAAPREGEA